MLDRDTAGCVVRGQTDSHLYLAPHPALRRTIAHYTITWPTLPETGEAARWILLPDASGCLIFPLDCSGDGQFWGATTRTITVLRDSPQEPCRLFVEFLPGGARSLLHLPQNESADLRAPLRHVCGKAYEALQRILEEATSLYDLTHGLDCWFLSQVAGDSDTAQGLLLALRELPAGSMRELSGRLFYSERQLERLFLDLIGIRAKTYARLTRVNRAAALIQKGGRRLTDVAQELGYCDQSHFIHDFKAVCGVTPTAYRRSLSDFYKEPYKF